VHHFVANSENVRERIWRIYARDSTVVFPPVDVDRFRPSAHREDFYLIVSALVPYKRIDAAIAAMGALRRPLVIAGSGPELARFRAGAGPHVRFTGWISDEEVADLMGRCRALLMPGVEDFGLVPVEAQASGAPVIALGRGGAAETVVDARKDGAGTGVFFDESTAPAIQDAVLRFERLTFDPETLRRNALRFHPDRFRDGMTAELSALLSGTRSG
jgi:glycosyltransferase involved in cell wall biosynthesis